MITPITHVHTIIAAETGEIVRYVLASTDHVPSLVAGEVVRTQTLSAYFGAPVEICDKRIAQGLAERLLAVLERHGPAVVEGLPQLKLVVVRPTAGEELAAAFWSDAGF